MEILRIAIPLLQPLLSGLLPLGNFLHTQSVCQFCFHQLPPLPSSLDNPSYSSTKSCLSNSSINLIVPSSTLTLSFLAQIFMIAFNEISFFATLKLAFSLTNFFLQNLSIRLLEFSTLSYLLSNLNGTGPIESHPT